MAKSSLLYTCKCDTDPDAKENDWCKYVTNLWGEPFCQKAVTLEIAKTIKFGFKEEE